MKKTFIWLGVFIFLTGFSVSAQYVQPQCNQTNFTPIQCGYYVEGYQDGTNDAQNNQESNYKRYRNKLDGSKYESYYRQGYEAGYSNSPSNPRWNNNQRNAYD